MLSKNNFFKCFLIIILAFFMSVGILAYKEEVEREINDVSVLREIMDDEDDF